MTGAATTVALVTGASSGIGRASARALARSGRRVFAGLRDPAKGADMARTAAAEGMALDVIRLDVTEADHVAEALGRIRAQAGVSVTTKHYPGQFHGFFTMGKLLQQANVAVGEIGAWLKGLR
jgi:NAD(P)-dependent dehydrogenase (short-subunit alcohol dehydrogenase family)